MIVKRYHTDAGRTETHPHETRDCTVRALAVAAGIPYEQAHAALKAAGRTDRKGIVLAQAINSGRLKLEGRKFVDVLKTPTCLGFFLKAHPKGTFLCRKARHAFAIVDGILHDNQALGSRMRVTHAWVIQPD